MRLLFGVSIGLCWLCVTFVLGLLPVVPAHGATRLDARAEARRAFEEAEVALSESEWARAELLLERTLMLEPAHAQARLELARLLLFRGKVEVARALIRSLIEDPRTPEGHREQLQALLARSDRLVEEPSDVEAKPPRMIGEMQLGWSRNPMARPDLEQLSLTFPGGVITLPLKSESRSGALGGMSIRRIAPAGLSLDVSLLHSDGGVTGDAYWIAAALPLPRAVSSGVRHSYLIGQSQRSLDGAQRHVVGVSMGGRSAQLTTGFYEEPDVDRRGAFARWEQQWRLSSRVSVLGFALLEHAASGPPSFVQLGGMVGWTPAQDWFVLSRVSLHRDLSGYSPWLEYGAARRMGTVDLALERVWRFPGDRWMLTFRAYSGRRQSNLDLFDYRDYGVRFGVRTSW